MIIEQLRMQKGKDGRYYLNLANLAKPKTVKVKMMNNEIHPIDFDCYGAPIFSKQQFEIFECYEKQLRTNSGGIVELTLKVEYEEESFTEQKGEFDNIPQIKIGLVSVSNLEYLLMMRKIRLKVSDEKLTQYVVFGNALLCDNGDIKIIEKLQHGKTMFFENIETYEVFLKNNGVNIDFEKNDYVFPSSQDVCPCCGKKFGNEGLEDLIITNPCIEVAGNVYHEKCYEEYILLKCETKLGEIIQAVYGEKAKIIQRQQIDVSEGQEYDIAYMFRIKINEGDVDFTFYDKKIVMVFTSKFLKFDFRNVNLEQKEIISDVDYNKHQLEFQGTKNVIEYLNSVKRELAK